MPLDPTAARVEREFRHPSALLGCRFDPSGRFLFASSQDNSILRFDLVTGGRTAMVGHTSWGRGLVTRATGSRTVNVDKVAASAAVRGAAIGPAAVAFPRRRPSPSRSSPPTTTAS